MYCRKCGKQIDYDAHLCKECQEEVINASLVEKETVVKAPEKVVVVQKPASVGSRMEGFGGALTSTILGVVAFILAYVALIFLIAGFNGGYYDGLEGGVYFSGIFSVGVFFMILALVLGIVSLVLGIKAIKRFRRQSREGKVKPIATLILGIAGVGWSGLALFFVFVCMMVCVA